MGVVMFPYTRIDVVTQRTDAAVRLSPDNRSTTASTAVGISPMIPCFGRIQPVRSRLDCIEEPVSRRLMDSKHCEPSQPHQEQGVIERRARRMEDRGIIRRLLQKTALCAALALMPSLVAGCSSSLHGWQVQTVSTPRLPLFDHSVLEKEPVAIFGAPALIPLLGNEAGIETFLADVLARLAPNIMVVEPREMFTRINRQGLTGDYARMRSIAEQANILDHEPLRKLGIAVGARYIFQPRLMLFAQHMTDRWSLPVFGVRLSQTRATVMRLSLQLWDAETGALLWSSIAEGTMQGEAMSQDPVYFKDIVRVVLGSIITDFMNGRTGTKYTPIYKLLDDLLQTLPTETEPKSGTSI